MVDSSTLPAHRDLPQWLQHIEACHPAEIELGLDRLKQVADRLGLKLERSFKVVAGGTNGKGSTLAMLDAILRESGLTTGRYSSPHFIHYSERVLLNGVPAEEQAFCDAFVQIEQARGDIPLTYFEYGTLAALIIMSDANVDVMLLEVGLGGRLDAVNIVDADLALVSTIALDHTDWLGPDRESIGYEKAGIFRADKPALCGDPEPPESLVRHAHELAAPLLVRNRDFQLDVASDHWSWNGTGPEGAVSYESLPLPCLPLANAALVLQTVQFLPWTISAEAIRAGLKAATLPGRMQRVSWRGISLVLDVAHNPEAAEYLATQLAQAGGASHLVLGMMHDKDISSVLRALCNCVEHWYPVRLDVPRAADVNTLKAQLASAGVKSDRVHTLGRVEDTLEALAVSGVQGPVVVAGSFFTVADALTHIAKR